MKVIERDACRIEDRRMPLSVDKPSVIVEMQCPDCGQAYLIVVAVADPTNFSEVCKPCWEKREVLAAYKATEDGLGKREVHLAPGEDIQESLMPNLAMRGYRKVFIYRNSGIVEKWDLDMVDGEPVFSPLEPDVLS